MGSSDGAKACKRDDGLAIVNDSSGQVLDRNENGYYCNIQKWRCVYYNSKKSLLTEKKYHLHATIKELPKMINERLSELSCNQEEFCPTRKQLQGITTIWKPPIQHK